MTDTLSPEQRSRLMSRVHGKDTLIEKKVRSYLHRKGYRFRKHVNKLPGSPDIVLPKHNAAIFIHGCFWHGHEGCRKSRLPTTRREFWEEKRRANLERDARKVSQLIERGWRVGIVWQCGIEKQSDFYNNMDILEKWINSTIDKFEIPSDDNLTKSL